MENKIYLSNQSLFNYTEDDDKMTIEGYICHFNKANLNNEIVYENSFDAFFGLYDAKKLIPILNFEHDSAMQIGGIDEIKKESDGLTIKAHLNKNIKYVEEWIIPNIKMNDLKGFSSEGWPLNGYDDIIQREDGTYGVKNFILTAVAVTSRPADYDAKFSVANAYKNLKPTEDEVKEEINNSRWYLM